MAKNLYSIDIVKLDTVHFTATAYLSDADLGKVKQLIADLVTYGAVTSGTATIATNAQPLAVDTLITQIQLAAPHSKHYDKINR